MNRQEAERIANEVASRYRARPRKELLRCIDDRDDFEVVAPSGNRYQIEVSAVWDDRKGNDLRVFISVDDGTFLAAIAPLTVDFIMAPDGRFISE
jgi:hypothetical protein